MPLVSDNIIPYPAVLPFDKQSVPVPGTKRPGQTAHYRNGIWGLVDEHTPGALTTLDQIFAEGMKVGSNRPFLGYRAQVSASPLKFASAYTWYTYGDVDIKRRHIGSAVHTLFQKGEIGGGEYPTVGIFSVNRPEWQMIDIGLQSYQKVSVSLYDTLGTDSVAYIIEHAHLSIIFSTSDHIPTLLKLAPSLPMLKHIVCIDTLSIEAGKVLRAWAESLKIRFSEFAEFEAYGKANLVEPIPASPDLIASICYTSGTTNNPKGVILKHKNLALATWSNMMGLELPEEGILFSYLPLAHIYERLCELCTIAVGGRIGYFSGDTLRLLEDAAILKPNFFPSVPRVLNRVYQAAMAGGNVPGLKGYLFNKAIQAKLTNLRSTGQATHAFWDKLVFRKIQAVLGGKLALVTSGSAPISPDVLDFLKIAFACEVGEGYGMTENCATCAKSWPGDPTASGSVGPPQAVNEIKLVDVPAMGYTSEDKPFPRGELCVRGDNCFTTYYKDEKNTAETVDAEGWIHTGDVAAIDESGRVRIVDRVKNIMKLAQGEYVALEKIENVFASSPSVAQLFVHGDGLQSYLIGVLVPDPIAFAAIVASVTGKKVSPEDIPALEAACKDERVIETILQTFKKAGQQQGLKGFEQIRRLHLTMVPFSIENNTLTPTLKIRRKDAYNLYKTELDALYALGEPSSASSKL